MKNIKVFLTVLMTVIMVFTSVNAYASDKKNIVKGLKYTIEFGVNTDDSYGNYTEEGEELDIDHGYLTDGKKDNGLYYTSYRGYTRLICFDFGKEYSVSEYYGVFYHGTGGVSAPDFIRLYLSDDGENYYRVSYLDYTPTYGNTGLRTYGGELGKNYKARYAKVEYSSEVFIKCSEIEIIGNENTENAVSIPKNEVSGDKGYYPKYSDKMNGIGSIIKIYDGYYPSHQEKADNTENELLPYIAYMTKSGKILDTFFDTVAFVPCHTDYPSGGRLVKTYGKPGAVMSDFELYISKTFGDGINLDALEKAAETRNNSLNITEKVKVLLTIPYPTMQSKPFGDVDGDGKNEYTDTLEGRVKIIKWYVEKTVSLFNERNYKNIELSGFYWYRESIVQADSDHESALIGKTKSILQTFDEKYVLLFDAFFLAEGFDIYEEIGFDGAVMQPNLAFRNYYNTEMLYEFAKQIKKFGLGVEIETAEPGSFSSAASNRKYGKIYESYLKYGAEYGYMDALSTFYQGAGPGTVYNFLYSSDTYLNSLYKATYEYVKGTYGKEDVNKENSEESKMKEESEVKEESAIKEESNTDISEESGKRNEKQTKKSSSLLKTIIISVVAFSVLTVLTAAFVIKKMNRNGDSQSKDKK